MESLTVSDVDILYIITINGVDSRYLVMFQDAFFPRWTEERKVMQFVPLTGLPQYK